jgi:hypothetical protein
MARNPSRQGPEDPQEVFSLRSLAPAGILPVKLAMEAAAWTLTGNMTAYRGNGHSATRLNNGKVLLAGGLGTNDTSIPTADLYQPIPGIWSATGSMFFRRNLHSATLLLNGKVLVAGGQDQQLGSGSVHSTAEIYTPLLGTWALTGEMSTPRGGHSATRLHNGRVLVAGGFTEVGVLATAELYDPGNATWSVTGEMAVPRWAHTATRLPDGSVLVAGGYDVSGAALETAEIFNPVSESWTPTGSMTTARGFHTAVSLTNEKVLVAGGVNAPFPLPQGFPGLNSAELYDSGTWTVTGSMTSPRFAHTLTRIAVGKALAAGGEHADISVLKSSETYDLSSGGGVWAGGPDMTTPRATHTATLLTNGKVLVAGGFFIGQGLITSELYAGK